MAEHLMLTDMQTGEAIREYLLTVKEGYAYGFYRIYKVFKPSTSYDSIRRYFYILKEIGLIEPVRFVKGKGQWRRHYFSAVMVRIEDPAWFHPQVELYPITRHGKRGYKELRDKGLKPKGGRRTKYRK